MKKVFYIFPLLLVVSIILLYVVLSLLIRILKAVMLISITRLDLTLPLLFGSLFNTRAALDVIITNFVILQSFTSLSDMFALSIFLFSAVSIISLIVIYKERTYKENKNKQKEFEPMVKSLCNI